MSLTLTEKSKIQIYPNEFIGHNVLNRCLLRLYDNDLIIYNSITNDFTITSGILQAEIDALDLRVTTNEAELDSLNLSGLNTIVASNSANWEWTYSKVNSNYSLWDSVYTTVNSTSGTWGGVGGSTTLSGLTDVTYVPSLVNAGDILEWSVLNQEWVPVTPAGTTGTTPAEVSGIIEQYDTANAWTETADAQAIMLTHTKEMSGFVLSAENAELRNTFYLEENLAGNRDYEAGHSMWSPYRSIGSAMTSAFYGWHPGSTDIQKRYINVNANPIYGGASIQDNSVTTSGGTGVHSQLHLVWTKADEAPNMPGELDVANYLPIISGNTFKIDGLDDIGNSWTLFKGLGLTNTNVFSGSIDNTQYFFSNCYIDLDEVTVSTPSKFVFDNSCTIDPGTASLTNLTIQNVGIPTYTIAPINTNYAALSGGYVVKDINELKGFTNLNVYGGIEYSGGGGNYSGAVQITSFDTNLPSQNVTPDHTTDDITIDYAGDYEINFNSAFYSVLSQGISLEIKKNNGVTSLANGYVYTSGSVGGAYKSFMAISTIATLNANDTVEAWFTGGTTINVQNPRLIVKRLG